jgi:hypothetical protein
MVYDMYRYDRDGAIYSGGPLHTWFTPTKSSCLGQYLSLLLSYDHPGDNPFTVTAYGAYHLIGKAIREYPNTGNTTWIYGAIEKQF